MRFTPNITKAQAAVIVRDVSGVAAVASIAVGAGMVFLPAGFIVGGLLVLTGVIAAARGERPATWKDANDRPSQS